MSQALQERLADLRIDMRGDIATRHIASIETELLSPGPALPPRRPRRRRIGALVLAGLLVLIPAAAAIAAEDAVPGEFLYPVKRTTEWVRSLVDPTIGARHRIQELETVVERGGPLREMTGRLADAEESVRDRPDSIGLTDRIDDARERMQERRPDDSEDHEGADATDGQSQHREQSSNTDDVTTTTARRGDGGGRESTTTTSEARSADAPGGDSRGRDG